MDSLTRKKRQPIQKRQRFSKLLSPPFSTCRKIIIINKNMHWISNIYSNENSRKGHTNDSSEKVTEVY
jgi:hypothetical protein